MRLMTKLAAFTGAAALTLVSLQPAQATDAAHWVANPGASIDSPTHLTFTGGNTSVETTNLDYPIQAGQTVAFDYTGTCGGGAPRVFLEVGGTYYNSFDGNPGQCGSDPDGDGTFHVTWTFPVNGQIQAAGVVRDNSGTDVVTVSNLTIAGQPIYFEPEYVRATISVHTRQACGFYRARLTSPELGDNQKATGPVPFGIRVNHHLRAAGDLLPGETFVFTRHFREDVGRKTIVVRVRGHIRAVNSVPTNCE